MGRIDTVLDQFVDQDGYMDSVIDGAEDEKQLVETSITDLNLRMKEREANLVLQYAELQAQLINMQYAQQQWAGIYSGTRGYF